MTTSTKSLTRRTTLAALPAAAIFGNARVAPGPDEADAGLIRAWQEFQAAYAVYLVAINDTDDACDAAWAAYPPRPSALTCIHVHDDRTETIEPIDREQLVRHQDLQVELFGRGRQGEMVRARRARFFAEADAWEAACATIDAAHGMPEADAAQEAAAEKWYDARRRLCALCERPASTLAGIEIKLRYIAQESYWREAAEAENPELDTAMAARAGLAALEDLERMKGSA